MKAELISVVKQLKDLDNEQEAFIASCPSSVGYIFADNAYTSAKGMQVDLLINALFGHLAEEIFWFLLEWKPGNKGPQMWESNGTPWIFETAEDYYKYLETL